MRILLITDNHTPTGGAEKYFFDLKSRLEKRNGLEVYSCGFAEQESTGSDHYVMKHASHKVKKLLWRLFFNPIIYLKLSAYLNKVKPDIIHLHNVKQYPLAVLRAIKRYPVVQTIHDHGVVCPTGQNIHKDLTPCATGLRLKCFWQHQVKFNPIVYLVMTLTFFRLNSALKKSVDLFISPSPLLINYLDINQFRPAKHIPLFKNEQINPVTTLHQQNHFFFAGNLGSHKGVNLLIDEFAIACKINSQLHLTIAGTGPEEDKMKKNVKGYGIENNVTFLGWQKNLAQYYQDSNALLFTSTGLEGFPLVIMESMMHARPVIGINRGIAAWIIDHNKTGLHFDPNKNGDLAEKILTLANQVDLARQLGKNGREKLDAMIDNEKVLEQIISTYREIIDQAK